MNIYFLLRCSIEQHYCDWVTYSKENGATGSDVGKANCISSAGGNRDFRGSLLLYIFTTYIRSILWSYEQRKSDWALALAICTLLNFFSGDCKNAGAPKSLIPPWWTDAVCLGSIPPCCGAILLKNKWHNHNNVVQTTKHIWSKKILFTRWIHPETFIVHMLSCKIDFS